MLGAVGRHFKTIWKPFLATHGCAHAGLILLIGLPICWDFFADLGGGGVAGGSHNIENTTRRRRRRKLFPYLLCIQAQRWLRPLKYHKVCQILPVPRPPPSQYNLYCWP